MSTITFDTFKYVERLERAGFVREQATAFVEAQREALSEALDTALATKKDIAEVKTTLQVLDAKFEKMTWMLGAVLALVAANFAKQYF
jgi:hypothetical protein